MRSENENSSSQLRCREDEIWIPGNEVALENLACCGRGQKKDQESLHFRNCFQLTNHLLTYRLLCDAISDHLLLEVCCIVLTVASNQFSLVVIIGNLFSTQDCISWPTTESGVQSVEGGDQRGTGLHRQGGGLWICPRGNSISPVRERTHSHSVWRVTEMPSHNPRLFLVSSSHPDCSTTISNITLVEGELVTFLKWLNRFYLLEQETI